MNNFTIAIILITLSVLDLYAIGNYRLIDVLYNYGVQADAALIFVGVALSIGVVGVILLLGGKR